MYPSWSLFPVWAVQHYDDVLWRGGRPCLLALRGANQATACKEATFVTLIFQGMSTPGHSRISARKKIAIPFMDTISENLVPI